jgi:hypothetical protein
LLTVHAWTILSNGELEKKDPMLASSAWFVGAGLGTLGVAIDGNVCAKPALS